MRGLYASIGLWGLCYKDKNLTRKQRFFSQGRIMHSLDSFSSKMMKRRKDENINQSKEAIKNFFIVLSEDKH
jgi:hypothetical protein